MYALDGKFQGVGSRAVKSRGVGMKKEDKCTRPPSTLQIFSLIAQSNSAVLSFLMSDFFFQLTSSFVIALGFSLRLHATTARTSL